MKGLLYFIIYKIADIHEAILQLNNNFEANLNDKMLHYWVIGLVGLAIFAVLKPLFSYLARKNKVGVIAWFYTYTVILGITFLIEIGQYFTGTGKMEFADIVFGVIGFLQLSLIWYLLKKLIRLFRWLVRKLVAFLHSKTDTL